MRNPFKQETVSGAEASAKVKIPILGPVPAPLWPPLGMIGLLALILLIFAPGFFDIRNLTVVLLDASIVMILAVGMTVVITGRGIDLSIGGILILSSTVMGAAIKDFDLAVWLAIPVALLVGASAGLFNGFLIMRLGIPDFIATLASELVFRGLALVYLGGAIFYNFGDTIEFIGRGQLFGFLPMAIFLSFTALIIGHIFMTYHRSGIRLHAVGLNPVAARRMGVNVTGYRIGTYAVSGFLAAAGGVVLTGRLDAVVATGAILILLQAIAATIVGGTFLFGGRSSMLGTGLGAILLAMIANAVVQLGFELFWQNVASGAVILLTLAINSRKGRSAAQGAG